MNIQELELTVRTYNTLFRRGIRSVEQLTAMTENDVFMLRGSGVATLEDVKEALAKKGLSLKESDNPLNLKPRVKGNTEFDLIKYRMKVLSDRLDYLEKTGKGMERYARKDCLSKTVGDPKRAANYQRFYWDDMVKMAKGIFLNQMTGRCSVTKVSELRVEQAELAIEYLNKAVELWNEYAALACKLDNELKEG
jgi:hypothetical protein